MLIVRSHTTCIYFKKDLRKLRQAHKTFANFQYTKLYKGKKIWKKNIYKVNKDMTTMLNLLTTCIYFKRDIRKFATFISNYYFPVLCRCWGEMGGRGLTNAWYHTSTAHDECLCYSFFRLDSSSYFLDGNFTFRWFPTVILVRYSFYHFFLVEFILLLYSFLMTWYDSIFLLF